MIGTVGISNDKTGNKEIIFSREKYLNYLLTYILIALGSSDFFAKRQLFLVLFLGIILMIFFLKKKSFNREFFYITGILLILSLANIIQSQFFSYWTTFGTFIRFLLPFFFVKVIGQNFPLYYVRVMKFLTLISFFFYFPAVLISDFNNFLLIIPETIKTDPWQGLHFLIYTIEYAKPWGLDIYRNAGPMGEPGEFAGYLVMALIFNTILTNKLWSWNNLIFITALIFTFSTMGYLAFFVFILSYYLVNSKIAYKFLLFPIIIIAAYSAYFQLDFLDEKISYEAEAVMEDDFEDVIRKGRLPNLWNNFKDSLEKPILGKGRNFTTRYENYGSMEAYEFSGILFDLAADHGWPFFILYFYLIYKSFKIFCLKYKFNPKFALLVLLILFTLFTAQNYHTQSFFISLLYLKNAILTSKTNIRY